MSPGEARADEVDEFLRARDRYLNSEFDRAAADLRRLLQGDPSTLQDVSLRAPVRRLYAACLLAQGREAEASAEIEALLLDDPDARADAVQFDVAFVRLFNGVRDRLEPRLQQERERRLRERVAEEAASAERRRRALALLTTETVGVSVPRGLAYVPFGVGQFANGQEGLGTFFLASEVLLLVTTVGTFLAYESLRPTAGSFFNTAEGAPDPGVARSTTLQAVNWVSVGLLVGTMLTGIIEANVAWRPLRSVRQRNRPIPPELRGLQLSLSPAGASLAAPF